MSDNHIGFKPQSALIIHKDSKTDYAKLEMYFIGDMKNVEWIVNMIEENTSEGYSTRFIT